MSKSGFEPLLYASTEVSADALYFGGVALPDAFIALGYQGRKLAVVSQLEFARVVREGDFDEVLPLEDLRETAQERLGEDVPWPVGGIQILAHDFEIPGFQIGADFPAGVALPLREAGVALELTEGMLFPQREFKDDVEAAAIKEGNAASSAGFCIVEEMLGAATIAEDGTLWLDGEGLTSERVRTAIEIACLHRGTHALNTIVAGGDQGCDPHCRGSGPLHANALIIVDIFPRVAATGFHGDMTRTYLKGTATAEQRQLVATVKEAHGRALDGHRASRSGKKLYDDTVKFFNAAGYMTEKRAGVPVGFIHGLGHGLGLEVHEPPRVNQAGTRLKQGQVITVEPGLYYPGIGGCRIEDVVRVQAGEPEMLSEHPYAWEIA